MSFIALGTNHRYSPISLRELLYFSKKRLKDALSILKERSVLKGAVILSTCNRIEVYASSDEPGAAIEEITDFIARYHKIGRERFGPYLYRYEDKKALGHLLQVACGLDSLILGETQILEQVKSAFSESESAGFADIDLKNIFYAAEVFADKVRQETGISVDKVSIGSITVDFIKERFADLCGRNILIIGLGKVSALVLNYLGRERPNIIFIANKTFEKAKRLASQIGARAVRFTELGRLLTQADIVITATSCPHFIINKEDLRGISGRRLLIIDLGLPRNVDPQIGKVSNIELYQIEDLESVIERNREQRIKEASMAQEMIRERIGDIWEKYIKSGQEAALSL